MCRYQLLVFSLAGFFSEPPVSEAVAPYSTSSAVCGLEIVDIRTRRYFIADGVLKLFRQLIMYFSQF